MKKIKGFVKKNCKFILGLMVGLSLAGTTVYAVATKDITYDNSKSGLTSTNLQGAIDELNEKATTKINEAEEKCPNGYNCIKMSFASDSWSTIAANVKAGKGTGYIVGDTKTVDMGSLGTHTVRVANTSACTNGETSQTACGFVVEFADVITEYKMNSPPPTNVGGWPASEMRSYVSSTIYNALPSDLKNVIASTTVVSGHGSTSGETNFTSTDKLYLLSTREVLNVGTGYDTAAEETRQLDYYKNNGVTMSNSGEIKQNNGSNKSWWLRTATAIPNISNHFFCISSSGGLSSSTSHYTDGVSPAFRIA